MNWAMRHVRTDGPSAQIVLYVIADTANERGVSRHADPDYIVEKTRQGRATVFRRLDELERAGALSRVVVRDPNGNITRYEIRLRLDRQIDYSSVCELDGGCHKPIAPECFGHDTQSLKSLRETLGPSPQSQVSPVRPAKSHPCDYESPSKSPDDDEDSGRGGISSDAIALAEELAALAGLPDPTLWPTGWCGAPMRVEAFLRDGYQPDILRAAVRGVMANRKDPEPPRSIAYFEKAFAKMRAQQAQQLPVVHVPEPQRVTNGDARTASANGRFQSNHQGESLAARALRIAREAAGDFGSGS